MTTEAARPSRIRFSIGQLMVVIVIAALLASLLRVPGMGPVLGFLCLLVPMACFPVLYLWRCAKPGRILLAWYLVTALSPLSFLWTVHCAWLVAYLTLGHFPGPADNGWWIDVLGLSAGITLLISFWVFVVGVCLWLCGMDVALKERRGRLKWAFLVLVIPFAWGVFFVATRWDPVHAIVWFMD